MTYLLDTNAISDLMRADQRVENWMANLSREAGDIYASLKLARQQRGLVLDENDLWVAATALALGATLVTRDRDFAGIDGLRVAEVV